jgi:hypothetical protein
MLAKYTHVCHKQEQQQHFDLSKEIMTIKAELLAVVNRLNHDEKKLMMRRR